jgi:hypothetical protein
LVRPLRCKQCGGPHRASFRSVAPCFVEHLSPVQGLLLQLAHCRLFLLRQYAVVVAELALGCRVVVVAGVRLLVCLLLVVVLALGYLLRLLGGLVSYLQPWLLFS